MRVDAAIEGVDLHLKSSDNLLLIGDLSIDHLESRQLCLHILTCSSQLVLRFCHLLFEVGLLMLEFANAFIARHGIRLAPFLIFVVLVLVVFLDFTAVVVVFFRREVCATMVVVEHKILSNKDRKSLYIIRCEEIGRKVLGGAGYPPNLSIKDS